jgi:hypothetical protein
MLSLATAWLRCRGAPCRKRRHCHRCDEGVIGIADDDNLGTRTRIGLDIAVE